MPEPKLAGRRYIPALDGLRAIAVIAVVIYHLGIGWAPGGLLGVGVFFTLSGYLITDVLLTHYGETGAIGLRSFWIHRARRLLPAVIVMLVVVTAWVTLFHRTQLHALRGAVVAALAYVSNWWLIGQNVSYFDRFGPPSPVGHLWSLAVEEQFYLIWPFVVLIGVRFLDKHWNAAKPRKQLATVTLLLAAASIIEMALLYHPGFDMTRIYDGTDTRAFGLLIGAALAMLWPSLRPESSHRSRQVSDWLGVVGLVAIAVLVIEIDEYSALLYRGGLVLLSLATALVIAAVVRPGSELAVVLGMRPLRWIGARSYGIYLWHFPIVVLTSPGGVVEFHFWRAMAQVTATVVVAALSWRFIEDPIRDGALGRIWARRASFRWRSLANGWRVVPLVVGVAVFATACVGMSTDARRSGSPALAADGSSSTYSTSPAPVHVSSSPASSSPPSSSPAPSTLSASPSKVALAASTTACTSVVHIGDSTSVGLISPDYLSDPKERIPAQYARVGVTTSRMEIDGGTSVLETAVAGHKNADQVADALVKSGYNGCWVIALGTNDTADVYVGSVLGLSGRIAEMMKTIGSQPVVWLTAKTLRSSGPYANANMKQWDAALVQACSKYSNMRVFDWASVVQRAWFGDDQIHYTSAGYAQRARLIANSLVSAFPGPAGTPPSSSCIVK
jgi:peptidoglycan/LPS O-acetylase OafA/YrhL